MKVSEDVLHNDAEMRQVAKLAEMYHEQKMKQTEKTRTQQQQQLPDSQKQQSATATATTTASTSATTESNTSTSATAESKTSRKRRKEEAKADRQQPSPEPLPEHVPTPVQTKQPLFFDVEDPILRVRFKNQLKRHNKLLESHKEMARMQKEVVGLQKQDTGKRLMSRIYDQVNTHHGDSLFGKTHSMQLNRLTVIDRRAMAMEATENEGEPSLSFGDMAASPTAARREWSSSPLVQQPHPFELDDADEFDAEDFNVEGSLFGDHAHMMMQDMDDYVEESDLCDDDHSEEEEEEVHSERDTGDKILETLFDAAIDEAVDQYMRLRGRESRDPSEKIRLKRTLSRHLKRLRNKKE